MVDYPQQPHGKLVRAMRTGNEVRFGVSRLQYDSLPDGQYLLKVGKALYLYARLEARVKDGFAVFFEHAWGVEPWCVTCGKESADLFDLRHDVHRKMSSGARLGKDLRKRIKQLRGSESESLLLDSPDEVKYSDYIGSVLTEKKYGYRGQSLMDKRNVLAHSSPVPHFYEGYRMLKRDLVQSEGSGGDRKSYVHIESQLVNDEWLDTFIINLEQAYCELVALEEKIYVLVEPRTFWFDHGPHSGSEELIVTLSDHLRCMEFTESASPEYESYHVCGITQTCLGVDCGGSEAAKKASIKQDEARLRNAKKENTKSRRTCQCPPSESVSK